MNKSLNVRLTLHARKVLENMHRNPVGASDAVRAAQGTADGYRFKLPSCGPAMTWLKKHRRAK